MTKRVSGIILFIMLFLAGLESCRKDDPINNNNSSIYHPTPFYIPRKPWYPQFRLPLDNPLTVEGVALGRMLFYDPIVSRDSSLACARCHRQEDAFTDVRRFSKGILDTVTNQQPIGSRNSMPVFNLMWQNRFFWDGRQSTLRGQIKEPIQAHFEMDQDFQTLSKKLKATPRYADAFYKAFGNTDISTNDITKAIEQFVVTIVSFESKFDMLNQNHDTLAVIGLSAKRGMGLFFTDAKMGGADCFHCHSNGAFFQQTSAPSNMANNGIDLTFTDLGFGNVTGLESDKGNFKVPSLRNVELTAPYMHDGRF
ncbi:MAG: cytochrome-c peroxidase, partial [Bacteroidia bacterium]|nr:cytochrome-c peroxidase [Bacteroidia bacterium]